MQLEYQYFELQEMIGDFGYNLYCKTCGTKMQGIIINDISPRLVRAEVEHCDKKEVLYLPQ